MTDTETRWTPPLRRLPADRFGNFCGDAEVVLANLKGKVELHRMSALFPKPFDSSML